MTSDSSHRWLLCSSHSPHMQSQLITTPYVRQAVLMEFVFCHDLHVLINKHNCVPHKKINFQCFICTTFWYAVFVSMKKAEMELMACPLFYPQTQIIFSLDYYHNLIFMYSVWMLYQYNKCVYSFRCITLLTWFTL